jgi:hypothetical protein
MHRPHAPSHAPSSCAVLSAALIAAAGAALGVMSGRSILVVVAATPTPESTPQRLAAIRAQMSLLADYL